jgi:hypothetical protein
MGRYLKEIFLGVIKFYDNVPANLLGVPCVASGVIEKYETTMSLACNFRRIGDYAFGNIAIIGKSMNEVSKAYNYTREYKTVSGRIKLLGKPVDLENGNCLYVFNMGHEDKSPWDVVSKVGGTILSPGISIEGIERNVVIFINEEQARTAKKLLEEADISDFEMSTIKWKFQKEFPPCEWLAGKLEIPEEFGIDVNSISQTYGIELVKSFNISALPDYIDFITKERMEKEDIIPINLKTMKRLVRSCRSFHISPRQLQVLMYMVQNPPKGPMRVYDEQLGKTLGVSRQRASQLRWSVIRKSLPLYYYILQQYDPLSYIKSLVGYRMKS